MEMNRAELLAGLLTDVVGDISDGAKVECSKRPDHWKVMVTDNGVQTSYHYTEQDGWKKVKEKELRKAKSLAEARTGTAAEKPKAKATKTKADKLKRQKQ
jgi:hypothetical protein